MGGEQDAAAPIVHVSTASYSEREARAAVMELAIFSCVNLIAETAARAEVRTFHKNKELHGLEHYAWNVQPNINQNAMQLKRELFARALYFGEALLVEEDERERFEGEGDEPRTSFSVSSCAETRP